MYKLIAFLGCLALASAGVVQVNPCDDGSMLPVEVRISGCDSVPCEIELGTEVLVEADGVALQELNDLLISVVSVRPDGTTTTVPIPDNNACNVITAPTGQTCPVPEGTEVTFASTVFANPIFPPGPTDLEVRLLMGSDTLVCFKGPIELIEP